MAFFKFRKGVDEPAAPASAPESVEAMRTRAKHRLIGSAVLVLAGVIGFPLLFDNQPRPIAVDIPIEIPDKAKAKPLSIGTPATTGASAIAAEKPAAPDSAASKPAAAPSVPAARAAGGSITPAPTAAVAAAPVGASTPPPAPAKPAPVVSKPAAGNAEAAKALALLEGKEVLMESKPAVSALPAASGASAAAGVRFIVQVGAYADVIKAREARQKLEKAGLKTYTQVINGPEGKRIRVRIGPYENKGEAERAAEKVRTLDLPAAILEL